jgi:hypothetical protein
MTTFKSFIRIAALVLRSIDWAAVARRCWITVQLITTALVLLAEIAWEHRAHIRQALVTAIAATYLAGQWTRQQAERTLRAGAWTRLQLERFSRRTAALLPQQPIEALAPITATLAAAREALERLIARLYPVAAA